MERPVIYTPSLSAEIDSWIIFYLIRKLKKRFNFFDLPDTLRFQFMGAHQNTTEKLEDWADRLLSLAIKAFRDLAEEHVYSQAVCTLKT